jgi:hypothetical protein
MTDDQAIDAILRVREDMRAVAAQGGFDLNNPESRRAYIRLHMQNTGAGSMSLPQYAMTMLPRYLMDRGVPESEATGSNFLRLIGLMPDENTRRWNETLAEDNRRRNEDFLRQQGLDEESIRQFNQRFGLDTQRFQLDKSMQEAQLAANPRDWLANLAYRNQQGGGGGVPLPQNMDLNQLPFMQAVNQNNVGALNPMQQQPGAAVQGGYQVNPGLPNGGAGGFLPGEGPQGPHPGEKPKGTGLPNGPDSRTGPFDPDGSPLPPMPGRSIPTQPNPGMPLRMPSVIGGRQANPQVWNRLAPSEQQAYMGAVSAQGQDPNDWLDEYRQSLPKGNFGRARWGT